MSGLAFANRQAQPYQQVTEAKADMDRKIVITLGSLLDTRDNPSVLIDGQYRIVAANQAYCDAYGVTPESVVGRTCHEVSHHSQVPCHMHGEACPHREVFVHGQASEVVHTHYDFENRPDYVRIRAYPLHDESGERFLLESMQRLAPRLDIDVDAYRLAGKSPAFLRFFSQLASVAKTGVTVWLHGEGGTGKSLAARFVHEHSSRKDGPFVVFNCAECLPGECESGLFDSARDDRGAQRSQAGAFAQARGGTLYLDAFDALPLTLQGKLLRVLDSGIFVPPGSTTTETADVRLIVATKVDLARLMAEGSIRQDLYFRIAEFPLKVPALRERSEDIPLIAESLLGQIAREAGVSCALSPAAAEALGRHSFPGNMRELRSLLLGAATRCKEGIIQPDDIDFSVSAGYHPHNDAPAKPASRSRPAQAAPKDTPASAAAGSNEEADTIRSLMKLYGTRRAVAKRLGISVPELYRKLKQLGIINLGLAALSVMATLPIQMP